MSAIAEPESTESGFQAGRYAAIDIGTVTCRMLVADVDEAGRLHELDREYTITNLGEGSPRRNIPPSRRGPWPRRPRATRATPTSSRR